MTIRTCQELTKWQQNKYFPAICEWQVKTECHRWLITVRDETHYCQVWRDSWATSHTVIITRWLNSCLIPQGFPTCINEILYQIVYWCTLIMAVKLDPLPGISSLKERVSHRNHVKFVLWLKTGVTLPCLKAELWAAKTESCVHFLSCLHATCHSSALIFSLINFYHEKGLVIELVN